jgi:putative endonuclease
MTGVKTELGRKGERLAAQYLKRQGYRILETNHRNCFGEIDIIAHDRGTLCFVEVKTRTTASHGHPFESVSRPKQRKLIRTAQGYLTRAGAPDTDARFDVVAVTPDGNGQYTLDLLKNAFEVE